MTIGSFFILILRSRFAGCEIYAAEPGRPVRVGAPRS
jgi:hypothetical protein